MNRLLYTLFLLLICLSGCVSVKAPNITEYALNPQFAGVPCRHARQTIRVVDVTVVPQYASLSFVYRLSEFNFTHDYYNAFFNKPSEQIAQSLQNYLIKANRFKLVLDNSGFMPTSYQLYVEVTKLYADYRDKTHPQAVVAMDFKLLNQNHKLIANRTFSSKIPLQAKNSCALIKAWSMALSNIYRSFLQSL